MENWVSYFNENQYGFSESFKNELSKQLSDRLKKNLECEDLFEKYFYNLFLGMKEIEIRESDNYIFGNAEIISPDSRSRSLTICWRSDFFENKLQIHKENVEGKINFFFCNDFPTEELKQYIKTKKPSSAKKKLKEDFSFVNFPDLSVKFEIKEKLTVMEENEIVNIFKRNKKIYVSDLKNNIIVLDFQIDFQKANEEIEETKVFIDESLKIIRNSSFGNKITNIIVE